MAFPTPYASHDLTGQTALVTGASSGLGDRFARTLAACGAKVALAARRADRLEALAEDIRAAGGVAQPFSLDVADAARIKSVVPEIEAALGPVSILVNNAGIPDAERAVRMSPELIDQVIAVNLRAPFMLSCEVARRLIELKLPGRIVNIASSIAYEYSGDGAALYATTKGAMIRMTEALSVEWARFHINVNAIAPGAFASEMMDGMLERVGEGFVQSLRRGRIGQPAQLDSTLLFLVSPASECVTGTCVRVDDGQHNK